MPVEFATGGACALPAGRIEGPIRPGSARGPVRFLRRNLKGTALPMNNIVYIVGIIVIVLAILSFFGLR